MLGVDEACHGSSSGTEEEEGVSDVVVEGVLGKLATEEVVAILIQGLFTALVGAWEGPLLWGKNWEPEFALEHDQKCVIGEAVVGVASVVGRQG